MASGNLYLDDGDSIDQPATTYIDFSYDNSGKFVMTGDFGYDTGVSITSVVVLGGASNGTSVSGYGKVKRVETLVQTSIPLTGPTILQVS